LLFTIDKMGKMVYNYRLSITKDNSTFLYQMEDIKRVIINTSLGKLSVIDNRLYLVYPGGVS
jgi:hypothetical protein